jgi:hypothetical protein
MVPRCSYSSRFRMMVFSIKHGTAHQAPTICSTGPDKSSIKGAGTRTLGGLDYKMVTGKNRQSAVDLNINDLRLSATNPKAPSDWFS